MFKNWYDIVNIQDEKDHGEDDSLQFTGKLFGGLIADVKRKIPWFVSDFTDAFHIQVSSITSSVLSIVNQSQQISID